MESSYLSNKSFFSLFLKDGEKNLITILIENEYNSGHWALLLRYNNTIEWFSSYGTFPSEELNFISHQQKEILNQDVKHLNILLTQALPKFLIIYNKRKLQQLKEGVNTCGKWIILRIIMMEKYNMDLNHFLQFIDNLKKQFKLSSDELVTLLIQK